MCGIAGILLASNALDQRPLKAIGQMTMALRHRGSDSEGFWFDREIGIAFGHRRLAMVDLSETGREPMHSASGRYVITFNGEIYNFRDLRRELEEVGYSFRGTGDTEIMLCAIERWGLDAAVKRFAGMFAFELWDLQTRTLHLVRDRTGKKPLYVRLTRDALVFASELKAITCFPGFQVELDEEAATAILPEAFKLPPGSIISVNAANLANTRGAGSLAQRVRPWWSLAEVASTGLREPAAGDDEEPTTELDCLLRLAVSERMVADVPLGACFSGGIDSSTVIAAARPSRDGILDSSKIEACWRQHLDENQDRSRDPWPVLKFEAWLCEAARLMGRNETKCEEFAVLGD